MAEIFIGTSGFYYSNWKEFYPQNVKNNEMLSFYSRFFSTVEINSTFYNIPRLTSIQKWRNSVPEECVFTFKANKNITHNPDLDFDIEILKDFLDSLDSLKTTPQKHVILFQLPASKKANPRKLEVLLKELPDSFRYAFEFRHSSWFSEEIYEQLENKNSAIVIADSPIKANGKFLWPRHDIKTADFAYFRLHGREKLYESDYSDEVLADLKAFIQPKLDSNQDVFVYFNNTIYGHGAQNGLKLQELLK